MSVFCAGCADSVFYRITQRACFSLGLASHGWRRAFAGWLIAWRWAVRMLNGTAVIALCCLAACAGVHGKLTWGLLGGLGGCQIVARVWVYVLTAHYV